MDWTFPSAAAFKELSFQYLPSKPPYFLICHLATLSPISELPCLTVIGSL